MERSLSRKLWDLPAKELREILDLISELDWIILREHEKVSEPWEVEAWRRKMATRSRNREKFYAAKCASYGHPSRSSSGS